MSNTKWYARGVYWLVGLALVVSLCWMLAGPVFAATVTEYTDETTSGQTIKASSDATPLLGINITNTTPGETLSKVFVHFTSVSGFTPDDLASGTAGVTIYDDSGTANGTFDANDTDIGTSVNWNYTALTATISTSAAAIPVNDTGTNAGDDFFVVIRTSSNITDGDRFTAYLGTAGVTTSAGTTGIPQVITNTITADTVAPTGNVTVDTDPIYDGDLVQVVTVTYNETMNATPAPTISFATTTGTWTSNADGAWDGTAKIWTENFTITDADEEVAGVNVTASGAKDTAGNTQVSKTEVSAFSVDTKNPTCTIAVDTDPIYDSDLVQKVTVTYNETMNATPAPTISFATTTGTWTSNADGAWDGTAKIWTENFTITDADEEVAGVNVTASGATDAAGNTQVSKTEVSAFSVDTKNPTVTGVAPASLAEADVGTVTVDVTFNENMTGGDTVTVTVKGLSGGDIAVAYSSWTSATVWRGTFTFSDNDEEVNTSYYAISGASDVAGNVMTALTSRGAYNPLDVDTVKPTCTIAVDTDPIYDGDLVQKATVTYNETMNATPAPTISFATTTGTWTSNADGAWDGTAKIWTENFTITDADEEVAGVNVTASGAKDTAGNTQVSKTEVSAFSVDTKNPTCTIAVDTDPIYDGDLVQKVTVTYNETMNATPAPTISFATTTGTWTSNADGAWDGTAKIWTENFTITDADEEVAGVNVTASGATDAAGNTQVSKTEVSAFSVDTKNPTCTIGVDTDPIYDSDLVQKVTVTYNETMNATPAPTISFATTTGTWTSNADGAWDGTAKIWTENFTITDANEEVAGVNVTASGAKDAAGNTQVSKTEVGAFSVDTQNPTVTVTSPNGAEYWPGGTTHNITWTATDPDLVANPITIEYSTDGGTNWVVINTSEENDGTYSWDVPNLDSSNCLVKVTAVDLAGNSGSDTSNAAFTITSDIAAPTVTVNSPSNGTENWEGGSIHSITWAATDDKTPSANLVITLEYSSDGGANWTSIATGEVNDGAYPWTVPNINSNQCLVKVVAADAVGHSGFDVSNDTFTITTPGAATTTIALYKDWNLISPMLYIPPANRTPATLLASVLGNVSIVWGDYDPANGTWKSYIPGGPPDLTEIRDGKGYWINMTAADTLNLSALGSELPVPPNAPPTYDVVKGWNLIGFKSTTPKLASVYLADIDGKYNVIYGYNATADIYFTVTKSDNLQPGYGYWIAINEAGTIFPS